MKKTKVIQGTKGRYVEINGNKATKYYPTSDSDNQKNICKKEYEELEKVNNDCDDKKIICPYPKVYKINLKNEPYYYEMDFIEGTLLHEFQFRNDDECIEITIKILEALKISHDANVFHSDLHAGNPKNLIIISQSYFKRFINSFFNKKLFCFFQEIKFSNILSFRKFYHIKLIDPDDDNTFVGDQKRKQDIHKCYTMIYTFIYPKMNTAKQQSFNHSFLSEKSKQQLEYPEFQSNVFDLSGEINNGYSSSDIPSIITALKAI
ncbi:protein kinase family protein [Bernardetia litoralis DSM 6794]|uniref:Protein kinase family protein n=1 Tax=Bernardetia litoralis (strain ATCC 23117 / DSM 6794 / NBRC 15988 / NCIMB 1366 / Fx l1 / Sio-4) TaxID=880071 RepID=I4ALG0_BERLS|nr:protein kinase [Bernardetia litoralis]AFM04795.1 protein kinase family protein [Bernardetia litoralis DSM 6794]